MLGKCLAVLFYIVSIMVRNLLAVFVDIVSKILQLIIVPFPLLINNSKFLII